MSALSIFVVLSRESRLANPDSRIQNQILWDGVYGWTRPIKLYQAAKRALASGKTARKSGTQSAEKTGETRGRRGLRRTIRGRLFCGSRAMGSSRWRFRRVRQRERVGVKELSVKKRPLLALTSIHESSEPTFLGKIQNFTRTAKFKRFSSLRRSGVHPTTGCVGFPLLPPGGVIPPRPEKYGTFAVR